MNLQASQSERNCPSIEIASYIDGELSPTRELELEHHFSICELCAEELKLQKEFLSALSSSLKSEGELELPANFTKVIVTNAESRVNGLRRPTERLNALFICVALLFFVLFALGADAGNAFGSVVGIFEQVVAVAGFASHFVYDVAIGTIVVLRSLSSQMPFGSMITAVLLGCLAFSIFALSRLVLRYHRT